jgi:hypothetical protein
MSAPVAARNNAEWCHAMCRAHGRPGAFDDRTCTNARRTPPLYPDAVTLTATASVADVLDRVDPWPGCSIKDSFARPDLAAEGFTPIIDAVWLQRPPVDATPRWRAVGRTPRRSQPRAGVSERRCGPIWLAQRGAHSPGRACSGRVSGTSGQPGWPVAPLGGVASGGTGAARRRREGKGKVGPLSGGSCSPAREMYMRHVAGRSNVRGVHLAGVDDVVTPRTAPFARLAGYSLGVGPALLGRTRHWSGQAGRMRRSSNGERRFDLRLDDAHVDLASLAMRTTPSAPPPGHWAC